MGRFLRLFHTLRHLRLQQIFYQVFYRLSGKLQSRPQRSKYQESSNDLCRQHQSGKSAGPRSFDLPTSFNGRASFTFLNVVKDFGEVSSINWNFNQPGKLWTYNLNYFEFIRQAEVKVSDAQELIDDWITKSGTHLDGWEPYPLSLRIVHWIRFYRERRIAMPGHVISSLHQQYHNLQSRIEYHLMGNHLLENAIALTMAAEFFDDKKYLKKASSLLTRQLKEQYLTTGAHYERSTMYHCILLWRLLDLYAEVKFPAKTSASAGTALGGKPCYFEVLKKSIVRQLNWLRYVVDENGNYPHFNDSTDGIAPSAKSVLDYATELDPCFGQPATTPVIPTETVHWSWPRKHPMMDVWIDASSVGPSYIPGHAHADDLTFCVALNGQRVIVDPAISTYEKNARRSWERSTVAHNTVTVNQQNSSDVWGGFRVGKRARTTIEHLEEGTKLVARHDGYPDNHRRSFELIDSGMQITDEYAGQAVARFHFDHTCPVQLANDQLTGKDFTIDWSTSGKAKLGTYQQATGFNQLQTAQVLEIAFSGELITFINHLPPIIRY